MNNENRQPISTQGDTGNKEDQLGGTTNLFLDQLQQEGAITNTAEDNPDGITDPDDLNEIRVDDDLNEPDVDAFQPDEEEAGLEDGEDQSENDVDRIGGYPNEEETGLEDEEDQSANDVDGNGGYPDEGADRAT